MGRGWREREIFLSAMESVTMKRFFKKRDEERGRRGREGKVISYCIP